MELRDEYMVIDKEDLEFFYGRFLRAYQYHRSGRDPEKVIVPVISSVYSPITGNRIPIEYVKPSEDKGISAEEVLADEVVPPEGTLPEEKVNDATRQLGAEGNPNPLKPKRSRSGDASKSDPQE